MEHFRFEFLFDGKFEERKQVGTFGETRVWKSISGNIIKISVFVNYHDTNAGTGLNFLNPILFRKQTLFDYDSGGINHERKFGKH